jgi:threonine aldolase
MAYQLNFNSDNCTSACPEVMDALIAANSGERGSYGIDEETAKVAELLKKTFETDALQSYPVATGTAANALAVASSTASYQALFCTRAAHLYEVSMLHRTNTF